MRDFVVLSARRLRGWPWPEKRDWGLSPMFGEDGWCRSCHVPRRAQCGPLVLQRKSFKVHGAWSPYWRHDAICLEAALAEEVARRFRVELMDVAWHASSPGDARQLIVPVAGERWFDHDELRERTAAQHGTPGATCSECGVWRWMPLGFAPALPTHTQVLPPLVRGLADAEHDVMASPEWFGDGGNAFRQTLVRRELASTIVAASPRDFAILEPAWK